MVPRRTGWAGLLLAFAATQAWSLDGGSGFVVAYPPPPAGSTFTRSTHFRVFADTEEIAVRKLSNESDAWFSFAGEVEVRVVVDAPVTSFTLSPRSAGIQATAAGSEIRFKLQTPRKLALHGVNNIDEVLAIFADPLQEDVPSLSDPTVHSVLAANADPTGAQDARTAIQSAIDALPSGHTLYVPAGVFKVSRDPTLDSRGKYHSLQLKKDMTLYLAPGAILESTSGQGGDFLLATGDNIRVVGPGTLNGNGQIYSGGSDVLAKGPVMLKTSGKNQTFRDFLVREAPNFNWLMFNSDGVELSNVKLMTSPDGLNRDGVDPGDVTNLVVSDVFIRSGDDSLVFKTHSPLDLRSVVRHSVLWNWGSGGAIKVGTQYWTDPSGGLHVENVDVISSPRNVTFYFDGQSHTPQNLTFVNLRCEDAQDYFIDLGYNGNGGGLKNVSFIGVEALHAKPILLSPTGSLTGVVFDGVRRQGALVSASGVQGSGASQVTYVDTQPSKLAVIAEPLVVAENDAPARFVVSRTGSTGAALEVLYSVRGTAKLGVDYRALSGHVTLPAGAASAAISVEPLPDALVEPFETLLLELSMDAGYTLGPGYRAQMTIVDARSTPDAGSIEPSPDAGPGDAGDSADGGDGGGVDGGGDTPPSDGASASPTEPLGPVSASCACAAPATSVGPTMLLVLAFGLLLTRRAPARRSR